MIPYIYMYVHANTLYIDKYCDTHTLTHRTEICKEAEITKKYKNILKLAPVNPSIRTYYIAVGSRKELDVS